MQTNQRDPRDLRVYTAEEFRQLERMAEYEREQRRIASLTPAQAMDEEFKHLSKKYAPKYPWGG
jgi:hypothetical protein